MAPLSRRYVCSICSKSYTKAEHLQRHQRSHSGDRPFTCEQCHQKFTRLDSLTRHQRKLGHDHMSPSRLGTTGNSPIPDHDFEPPGTHPGIHSGANSDAVLNATDDSTVTTVAGVEMVDFSHNDSLLPNDAVGTFMPLTWPDSEAFLQSILNIDVSTWPETYDALPSHHHLFQSPNQASNEVASPWLANNATDSSTRSGTTAVRNVSQIISNLSSNLASEAETAALSTTFLEACLHTFFEQMTPALPVCHRPTFVFGDWTHPLLLNSIALGSLFMGQDINIARGEVLWTLAHTAVATSWHSLIQHRGPYDTSNGVQLVMTAVLGQTFAMLSGSSKLRSTAQIFHSLGFYWARQCGFYSSPVSDFLIHEVDLATEEDKLVLWRKWAAEEVKLRALLAHYILDGQLTYFAAAPTCQRHTSNLLPFPSSDKLFASSTLNEWLDNLRTERPTRTTFNEFFISVFQNSTLTACQDQDTSFISMQVVLEGLQSLVTDLNIVGDRTVGSPSASAIEAVLYSFPQNVARINDMSSGEKLQLLLRWHMICIDKAVHFSSLCKNLCAHFDIQQGIFAGPNMPLPNINFNNWTRTRSARKALLHAVEIRNILSDLPMRTFHAIHIPCTLFAAAIIHISFVLGGTTTVVLPKITQWSTLKDRNSLVSSEASEALRYLSGADTTTGFGARNLLYDMNNFLLLTKQLRRPWAICKDIGTILHQMYAKCGS